MTIGGNCDPKKAKDTLDETEDVLDLHGAGRE